MGDLGSKIYSVELDGQQYSLGYKVVTEDLKSLGLRRNPNIIQFPLNEWYYLDRSETKKGSGDWGGIWVARTLSGARNLQKYMMKQYSQDTRIFSTAIDKILYHNSYRIKTNGIKMLEEITKNRCSEISPH